LEKHNLCHIIEIKGFLKTKNTKTKK